MPRDKSFCVHFDFKYVEKGFNLFVINTRKKRKCYIYFKKDCLKDVLSFV